MVSFALKHTVMFVWMISNLSWCCSIPSACHPLQWFPVHILVNNLFWMISLFRIVNHTLLQPIIGGCNIAIKLYQSLTACVELPIVLLLIFQQFYGLHFSTWSSLDLQRNDLQLVKEPHTSWLGPANVEWRHVFSSSNCHPQVLLK